MGGESFNFFKGEKIILLAKAAEHLSRGVHNTELLLVEVFDSNSFFVFHNGNIRLLQGFGDFGEFKMEAFAARVIADSGLEGGKGVI